MNGPFGLLAALRRHCRARRNGAAQLLSAAAACLVLAACGGGSSSPGAPAPSFQAALVNSVPVIVDKGPTATSNEFNVPYVSVTVCRPGTAICQTIDHVMVDTGSFGLRIIAPLDPSLGLPALKTSSGAAIAECGQFISGITWGSVAQADVKLGGEVAAAQSIQLVGDAPGGAATPPAACTDVGSSMDTVAALGANGILGVGLFKQDCGSACVSTAISAMYYACANSACTSTTMPLARQVGNPVAAFGTDHNGVVLTLPPIGTNGATSLAGSLIFGIGTQSNNHIRTEVKYLAGGNGNFTTVYKGATLNASFIDSGSNGLFFNDPSLPVCTVSTGFFCPPTPVSLSATNRAYDGSASGNVTFQVASVDQRGAGISAGFAGGPFDSTYVAGSGTFDWGLPFFYGRRVFVGFEGTPGGAYWAY